MHDLRRVWQGSRNRRAPGPAPARLSGISALAHRARLRGACRAGIDCFVMDALFTTITNVNFDPARLQE
jgi:hydroxylamine reductase (hybrid-cluster protein)